MVIDLPYENSFMLAFLLILKKISDSIDDFVLSKTSFGPIRLVYICNEFMESWDNWHA